GDRLFYTAVLAPALLAAAATLRVLPAAAAVSPASLTSASLASPVRPTMRLAGNWRGAAWIGFLLVWSGWNATLSVSRAFAWRDNLSLVRADLASQPDAIGLYVDLGNLLAWNFDGDGARRAYREAVRRGPHSPRALRALAGQLEPAAARTLLERAL